MGTYYVDPTARTIIDIGGQDSKVIELDEYGTVTRFEMNDRCAAGTGRFFEVLTHRLLGIEMSELSDLMKQATKPCIDKQHVHDICGERDNLPIYRRRCLWRTLRRVRAAPSRGA